MATRTATVVISPPDFQVAEVIIEGSAPLVIERFAAKAAMMEKMAQGQAGKNKRQREARDYEAEAQRAKHVAEDGWEGIHAGAFRNAFISACKIVGFPMTRAKLSVFVIPDGFDVLDGDPLVRIFGGSQTHTAHTRNETGVADIRSRPMYRSWAARLRIRFDAGQFLPEHVLNLVARAGLQVGIGAGRPDSKKSCGCGWGTFRLVPSDEEDSVRRQYGIEV